MAQQLLIVSNNPRVLDDFDHLNIHSCASYEEVLHQVRNKVHAGARLLMHPLAGSVKPGESPYRSVVIDDNEGALDMQALEIIEGAIDRYNTLTAVPRHRVYNEQILADFQVIDRQLLISALTAIDPNLLRC